MRSLTHLPDKPFLILSIGDPIHFSDGQSRIVDDVLFNVDTGEAACFVVTMDPNTVFSTERRAVRADKVTIHDDGRVIAALNLQSL